MGFTTKFVLLCCVVLSASRNFENEKEYDAMLLRIMDEDVLEKEPEPMINEIQTIEENNQIISDTKTSVFINPHGRMKRQVIEEGGSGAVCQEIECKSNSGYICKTPELPDCECSCECSPGYYNPNNVSASPIVCTKGKMFGGRIVFVGDYDGTNNETIINETTSLFSNTSGFIGINVLSIESGSIIVEYELIYENLATVNSTTVQSNFECDSNVALMPVGSLQLKVTESCETVVDSYVLCGADRAFENYCDSQTTNCSVNDYGYAVCSCNDKTDMYNINETVCIDQICLSNADCNGPFGWCNTEPSIRTCTCMWGFSGVTCTEPWVFTLTIVASGCGLIIIILIGVACYCSRTKNNTKAQKTSKRPGDNGEIDLQNPFTSFQPGMMRAWLPEGSRNVDNMQMTSINNGKTSNSPSVSMGRNNSGETEQTNGHTNASFEGPSHQREASSTFAPSNSGGKSNKDNKALDYF